MENPIEGFDTSYAGDKTRFTVTNSKKVVEFNITHEFVSGTDGKVLPKEVTDLIPEAFKAKKGDTVTPKDFTTKEIKVDDGTWTFTKWDKDSAVVESDIKFIGTWTFKENPVTPVEFDITHEFVSGTDSSFSDVPSDHWAYESILRAEQLDRINGYPDKTFRPDEVISREEVVTVINRMLNRKADENYVETNRSSLVQYTDLETTHWSYLDIMEASNGHDYTRVGEKDELWLRLLPKR